MRLPWPAVFQVIIILVAACSGPGSSPPGSALASDSGTGDTIAVRLSDGLTMAPARMTVKAGRPTTFVVTNAGATNHEFYLGDAAAQAAHEAEMASMGGMSHDEPAGIGLKPGETKSLTYTFPKPGEVLAGCHVTGHYAAGMKALITVTD